ncbi:MAG TPA: spore coat associated protein CotJA [Pseudobacteroides sp.]|uniref:spore coat associated protein CotJA n=1 Tax=Pseudobacteroides sp. TaxID=1968840 RepID=UPI002F939136
MNTMNNNNLNNPNAIYPVSEEMPKLAHAYVPFQYMNCLYTPEVGLKRGTIFPELDRPYGVDPEYTVDA